MRSQTPSPHFGQARLHTMMSFGHVETTPEPPEQLLNVQPVVPPQYTKHGDPPEHTVSQLVAPLQLMSHVDPPEQSTAHVVTPRQST
jgi:hypothetical protein